MRFRIAGLYVSEVLADEVNVREMRFPFQSGALGYAVLATGVAAD